MQTIFRTQFFLLVLFSQITWGQTKSQSVPIQFKSKSINGFVVELPQKMDYVTELFYSKFELAGKSNSKKTEEGFTVCQQIKLAKISPSFLDLYYKLEETKTDTGSFIKITLLVSKGYDNFINFENDQNASQNSIELLSDIEVSVERRNIEVTILKKENDLQLEKQKLLLLEEELQATENEKREFEKKIAIQLNVLKLHSESTLEMGNQLEKLKKSLSSFEKNTSNKSKAILKTVSKQ